MQDMTPFDVVAFLFLVGWFILGYFQGLTRRAFGIIALVFALLVAVQLRDPVGKYLAGEWRNAPPEYSYMVAFGAVFLALWVAMSIGIQLFYRPAPLLERYPVLDEIIGGALGVLEGAIVLVVVLLVTDPYFLSEAGKAAAPGEFSPMRSLHELFNDSLTASFLRHTVISNVFAVVGWMFPSDVVDAFRSAVAHLRPLA
ncbi:MAG TPA: CvpA family protein [Candidatus Limnocylindrales bacterium]|nr:CvpA family protein [Candidatus Limnocylindrales bacterium]